MVYLDAGDSPAQMWADAKAQAKSEIAKWPYQWMDNPEYPLDRGDVTGSLKLYDGRIPAANALLVLADPSPDWQVQTLGYIFSTRADADGNFTLAHVRPGTYTLCAMIPGVTEQYRQDNVTVAPNGRVDLGTINFVPAYYSTKLWQIGQADWRATGFKFSDQPRQYGLNAKVPADLTYVIGKSHPSQDWYNVQSNPGTWNINFDLDKGCRGQAILTIGIAGQTNNPQLTILVNDKEVDTYAGGNSSAAYRSAILGSSYHETGIIKFPAADLHVGTNTVSLKLTNRGAINYDVVKLEIDDPSEPKQVPSMGGEGG
jgi:rhamnogalacturonan endolyase